jgi:predicted aconitase
LGCALASYGSQGMYHFVGVTPEAPSVEAALAGNTPWETMRITDADIEGLEKVLAEQKKASEPVVV